MVLIEKRLTFTASTAQQLIAPIGRQAFRARGPENCLKELFFTEVLKAELCQEQKRGGHQCLFCSLLLSGISASELCNV